MTDKGPTAWKVQQAVRIWHERVQQMATEDDEERAEVINEQIEAETSGLSAMQMWLVRSIRRINAMHAYVQNERASLMIREKRFAAREESYRSSLAAMIEITAESDKKGNRSVELPIATLSLAAGERKLIISDGAEKNIPDKYYETVEMVKVRKGLRKDDLITALTTDKIDPDTGEVAPPQTYDGIMVSNEPPKLRIRSK